MTARLLGSRPALAAPGRSAGFAGEGWPQLQRCQLASSTCAAHLVFPTSVTPRSLCPRCAVCRPLRKAAVRRQAAADPPAPLPPPPAGAGPGQAGAPLQPGVQPQPVGALPQPVNLITALMDVFSNPKYSCSLAYICGAAYTYWAGVPMLAGLFVAVGVGVLLAPM